MGLHFGARLDNRTLMGPLLAFCVLFPMIFFRYARSLWLALDSLIDASSFDESHD